MFDAKKTKDEIVAFIRNYFKENNLGGNKKTWRSKLIPKRSEAYRS